MAIRVKTFKISAGGLGTEEVSRFISRTIGRDLSLIQSISGTSLNATTTEITLSYSDKPSLSIQHIHPSNGFVSSTGSALETAYLAFSSPVNPNAIVSGNLSVDGVQLTGFYNLETGSNDYVMAIDLASTIDTGSIHNLIIDQSLKDTNNREQAATSVFGFTESDRATIQPGYEHSYTALDQRGTTKLKYARIDASTDPTKKVTELLVGTSDLLAFTAVQKSPNTTELFLLVIDKAEPKVSDVFPRQGANNPVDESFNKVILTFDEPVNTKQIKAQTGLFAVHKSFGVTADIDPTYITIINSKAISFDMPQIATAYSVTSAYISIFLRPGLQGVNGISLTKGYFFGHVTSDLASASQGPKGDDGDPGADGTGITWLGNWAVGTTYEINDAVYYTGDGSSYISPSGTNLANYPSGDSIFWDIMARTGSRGEPGADGLDGDGTGITWKGAFVTGDPYAPNDAVSYINNSYIRTGVPLTGQFPDVPGYWDLLARSGDQGPQGEVGPTGATGISGMSGLDGVDGSDGDSINWRGDWLANTIYNALDAVHYIVNGNAYIGTATSFNIAPTNTSYWDLMARTGSQGDPGATGASGMSGLDGSDGADGADGADGSDGSDGTSFIWSGNWTETNLYAVNDAVHYTGDFSTYIAIDTGIGNYPDTATAYWDIMARSGSPGAQGDSGSDGTGITWSGNWNQEREYLVNDAVLYLFESNSYLCTNHVTGFIGSPFNPTPDNDTSHWALMARTGGAGADGSDGTGFVWEGVWSGLADYDLNDIVSFNGISYIATGDPSPGDIPSGNSEVWEYFARTFDWQGEFDVGQLGFYEANDVVSYLNSNYILTGEDVFGVPGTPNSNWDLMLSGSTELQGPTGGGPGWTAEKVYDFGHVSAHQHNTFQSTYSGDNSGNEPSGHGDPYWRLIFAHSGITSGHIRGPDTPTVVVGNIPSYASTNGYYPVVDDSNLPVGVVGRTDQSNTWTGVQTFANEAIFEGGFSQAPYTITPTGGSYFQPDFSQSNTQKINLSGIFFPIISGAVNTVVDKRLDIIANGDPSSPVTITLDSDWQLVDGTIPASLAAGETLNFSIVARTGVLVTDIELTVEDGFDQYYRLDGTSTLTASMNLVGFDLISVGEINGENFTNFVQKFIDHTGSPSGPFNDVHPELVRRSGSSMSGDLDMSGNVLQNVGNTGLLYHLDTVDSNQIESEAVTFGKIQDVVQYAFLQRTGTLSGPLQSQVLTQSIVDFESAFTGHTGDLAGTTAPASPYDGQRWYSTTDGEAYYYNSTVSKWLGDKIMVTFGRSGSWNNSTYGRTINGLTTSATIGQIFPYDVTLVEMGYTHAAAVATSYYMRVDGSNVAIISSNAVLSGRAQDVDVSAGGVIAPYKTTGGATSNVHFYMLFRRLGS